MGKKTKKINKKVYKKGKSANGLFLMLIAVFLVSLSLNLFIWYYWPVNEGLNFLFYLFDSNNMIGYSTSFLVISSILQYPIIGYLNPKIKELLSFYFALLGSFLLLQPAYFYNSLLNNKIIWENFLYCEYILEGAICIFIFLEFENLFKKYYNQKKIKEIISGRKG